MAAYDKREIEAKQRAKVRGWEESWEYYARGMDKDIAEEFVNITLPALKAKEEEYNKKRGRVNAKLAAAKPYLKVDELTPCEIKVFIEMRKRGQAGLGLYGKAIPDCSCEWCCKEGPTCTQYKWNRILDRY
jgi:hypothetical protein